MSSVLITGANGGIGKALCQQFFEHKWHVIGTDIGLEPQSSCHEYVSIDLIELCQGENFRSEKIKELTSKLSNGKLELLINNAALQIVSKIESIEFKDWQDSFHVNVNAPFLLVQSFLKQLEVTNGMVLNIGSIHSRLTKSGFSAYATSKSALDGLTRSLAIELGGRVRVNSINPAAISTPMLTAGFKDNPAAFSELESYHPSGCVGDVMEIARTAYNLANESSSFFNGVQFNLDGGIGSKLHDPD